MSHWQSSGAAGHNLDTQAVTSMMSNIISGAQFGAYFPAAEHPFKSHLPTCEVGLGRGHPEAFEGSEDRQDFASSHQNPTLK